ncbi:MAG: glycosyltransferase family 2 protein [Bacteroidales bacterium]|nr:glycosyltransferase family 2 protein [Bacteroidales bacterium]
MSKNYLVFIPVYNEEKNIHQIIRQIQDLPYDLNVLVIDDGSEDNTKAILQDISGIHTIFHASNEGYGQTLIDGFNYCIEKGYDNVITIDSDKQHQPEEIPLFLEAAEGSRSDILSGSRYLHPGQETYMKAPVDRVKVNRRITEKINALTGYQLTDAFCGFKLYRVDALKKLKLTEPGYGMPLQLWIQAGINKLSVSEVPVELIYFDHNTGVAYPSLMNLCRRYRYYLKIIEKETQAYETTHISRSSR